MCLDDFIKEIDDIESMIDILLVPLNEYAGTELEKEQHNYYLHIKTRFCKCQVRHYELTGSYYLINRIKKHL